MVDGVQVALPSYEEAVYGSSGHCVPPADPRVQIVLSEGSAPSGRNVPREQQLQGQGACSSAGGEDEAPGHSGLCEAWGSQGSETVMVHQATTSSWVAGSGSSRLTHKDTADSENSDIQSLLSLTSEEYTDGKRSLLNMNYCWEWGSPVGHSDNWHIFTHTSPKKIIARVLAYKVEFGPQNAR